MAIEEQARSAQIVTGKATGTGAAINVSCGFVPVSVKVWNLDNVECHIYNSSMSDGHSIKLADTCSALTSNGITPYDGGTPTVSSGTTGAASKGFTIGSTISINTDTLYYEAIG